MTPSLQIKSFWELFHLHFWEMTLIIVPSFIILQIFILGLTVFLFRKFGLSLTTKLFELKSNKSESSYHISTKTQALQDSFIYSNLGKLNQFYGANTSAVFQFHNGGEFRTKVKMEKWSLTHDMPEPGNVSFHLKNHRWKDQFVSQANEWLGHVLTNKIWSVAIDELPTNSVWRREFVRADLQYALFYLVETNDIPEFVLAVFWDHLPNIEHTKNSITEYADVISAMIHDEKLLTENQKAKEENK